MFTRLSGYALQLFELDGQYGFVDLCRRGEDTFSLNGLIGDLTRVANRFRGN